MSSLLSGYLVVTLSNKGYTLCTHGTVNKRLRKPRHCVASCNFSVTTPERYIPLASEVLSKLWSYAISWPILVSYHRTLSLRNQEKDFTIGHLFNLTETQFTQDAQADLRRNPSVQYSTRFTKCCVLCEHRLKIMLSSFLRPTGVGSHSGHLYRGKKREKVLNKLQTRALVRLQDASQFVQQTILICNRRGHLPRIVIGLSRLGDSSSIQIPLNNPSRDAGHIGNCGKKAHLMMVVFTSATNLGTFFRFLLHSTKTFATAQLPR